MVNKSSPRFSCTVFLKYASAYQFELLARYQSTWQRGKCCVWLTKRISIKYSIKRSLRNSHVRHWSITWGQDHPVSPNQLRRIEHLNFPAKVAFILFNCPGQTRARLIGWITSASKIETFVWKKWRSFRRSIFYVNPFWAAKNGESNYRRALVLHIRDFYELLPFIANALHSQHVTHAMIAQARVIISWQRNHHWIGFVGPRRGLERSQTTTRS